MFEPMLFQRLKGARRVLLAGAGGGFDVYATLPIAIALAGAGTEVAFASLSFAPLQFLEQDAWLDENLAAIGPDTHCRHDGYFPERTLARWLDRNGLPATVYAFPMTGVRPLRAAYRRLITHLDATAVVIVSRPATCTSTRSRTPSSSARSPWSSRASATTCPGPASQRPSRTDNDRPLPTAREPPSRPRGIQP